jgi:flagella basal body P-ring formation protein FlgA
MRCSRFTIHDPRSTIQGSSLKAYTTHCLLSIIALLLLLVYPVYAQEASVAEARLIHFIKQIYSDGEDIQVRFGAIPSHLKGDVRIKNVNFSKIPDASGEGLCVAEVMDRNGREKTVYVPFKVFTKKKLFVLKSNVKKGDTVDLRDTVTREMYLNGGAAIYPAAWDDIGGKRFIKDLRAGTVLTYQVLEDPVIVQRGEIVNIVAYNGRLSVQAKGKTLDKGRMGDTIRVKNVGSGREISGKVTGSSTITVQF